MTFDPDMIKSFVKGDLGCTCADEVFNRIRFEKDYKIRMDLTIDCIITIGNRLLIFVILYSKLDKLGKIDYNLNFLLDQGKAWRDCEELNRFRLVIGAKSPGKIKKKLFEKFNKLENLDDKVHLHVIKSQTLKDKAII